MDDLGSCYVRGLSLSVMFGRNRWLADVIGIEGGL